MTALRPALTRGPVLMLAALASGVAAGAWAAGSDLAAAGSVTSAAAFVGGAWIDALRMTIAPLVFALVVTGLNTAGGLGAGTFGAKALGLFLGLLAGAAALAALIVPNLLAALPPPALPPLAGLDEAPAVAAPTALGSAAALVRGLIPANPIRAAADGAMAPLVVFALIFGFAAQHVAAVHRDRVVGLFDAIAQILLKIVRGVLWTAPVGVFALAVSVGAKAGFAVAGALAYYVVLVCGVCLAITAAVYAAAAAWARRPLGAYARAMAPAQLIAFSTQSSLAAMPAVLVGAERLRLSAGVVKVLPPLAVTVFRITAPAANVTGALYLAAALGVVTSPAQVAAAAAIAVVTSFSSVGLPVQISYLAMLGPICAVLGVPFHWLPLLLAVEPLVDTCRTLGNVTGQFASICFLGRREDPAPA
ncbi:dicarboxylate/amino acid:cation symporter [Phenylobacterium sp. VNQ135]|uniref:dicarboxylate/amino acid:cation symporter n=1 Tax=Phenylobacterium sp. VNQ135 TaxID=3400922 RepID=UPI003BFFB6FB